MKYVLENLMDVSCGEFYFEEDDIVTPRDNKTTIAISCDTISSQEILERMCK